MPSLLSSAHTLPLVPTPATVSGCTYIVTGANTGLGYECAKHLIALGAARVILAVRSLPRGEDALSRIHAQVGRSDNGEVWELDLASFASIEAFAERVAALERVDALIENAAVATGNFALAEGYEESLMVNVVGTMLLAVRVLPKLQESAKKFGTMPHLVVVSSRAAFVLKGLLEHLEGDIFQALSKDEGRNVRYPVTKLLEIYAVRELASRFPVSETGVVINVLSPGLCSTDLARNTSWFLWLRIFLLRLLIGRTAEEGSRTLLHAAFAGRESHGKYLSDCQIEEDAVPTWVTNEHGSRMQKRVWRDLVKTLESKGHAVNLRGASEAVDD